MYFPLYTNNWLHNLGSKGRGRISESFNKFVTTKGWVTVQSSNLLTTITCTLVSLETTTSKLTLNTVRPEKCTNGHEVITLLVNFWHFGWTFEDMLYKLNALPVTKMNNVKALKKVLQNTECEHGKSRAGKEKCNRKQWKTKPEHRETVACRYTHLSSDWKRTYPQHQWTPSSAVAAFLRVSVAVM